MRQKNSIKKLMQNKRGDIPITILVFGVLAICTLAIFSFIISNNSVKNSFDSIGLVEKVAIEKEKISLYEGLGFSDDEIYHNFNIKEDVHGRYIEMKQGSLEVRYNLGK